MADGGGNFKNLIERMRSGADMQKSEGSQSFDNPMFAQRIGTPPSGYRPSGDQQFYQPIYQPQYQNYSTTNPMAVSQYGQNPEQMFGNAMQMQNPFDFSEQMQYQAPANFYDYYGDQNQWQSPVLMGNKSARDAANGAPMDAYQYGGGDSGGVSSEGGGVGVGAVGAAGSVGADSAGVGVGGVGVGDGAGVGAAGASGDGAGDGAGDGGGGGGGDGGDGYAYGGIMSLMGRK